MGSFKRRFLLNAELREIPVSPVTDSPALCVTWLESIWSNCYCFISGCGWYIISPAGWCKLVVSFMISIDEFSLGESISRGCSLVAQPPPLAVLTGVLAAWLFLQPHREQAQQSTGKDGAHPNSYGVISWHLLLGRQEKEKGKSFSTQTPKGICKCWEWEKMKERQRNVSNGTEI